MNLFEKNHYKKVYDMAPTHFAYGTDSFGYSWVDLVLYKNIDAQNMFMAHGKPPLVPLVLGVER